MNELKDLSRRKRLPATGGVGHPCLADHRTMTLGVEIEYWLNILGWGCDKPEPSTEY